MSVPPPPPPSPHSLCFRSSALRRVPVDNPEILQILFLAGKKKNSTFIRHRNTIGSNFIMCVYMLYVSMAYARSSSQSREQELVDSVNYIDPSWIIYLFHFILYLFFFFFWFYLNIQINNNEIITKIFLLLRIIFHDRVFSL